MKKRLLLLFAAIAVSYLLSRLLRCKTVGASLEPPSPAHPLGTGPLGRDAVCVLAASSWGSMQALAAGLAAGLAVLAAASTAGVSRAAWRLVASASALLAGMPRMALLMVLALVLVLEPWQVGALIGALAGLQAARAVASRARQLAREPYVEAAYAVGAGRLRILAKHLLPGLGSLIAAQASLAAAAAVYAQTGLSMLGLGSGAPSWGRYMALILSTPGAAVTPAGLIQLATSLALVAASAYLVYWALLPAEEPSA